MRKGEIAVSLALMAIGIIVIVDSVRLGFGWGETGPQSGFFPFYLGLGTMVCSLLVLGNVVLRPGKGAAGLRLVPEGAWRPILWVLVPAAVMVGLTELVGLHIAAALYLGFYMRAVGKIGWVTTLLVALLVPLALYVAFDRVFLVPLPQGLWGAKLIPF